MNREHAQWEEIDRYLEQRMDSAEREAFEARIQQEPELAEDLRQQQLLLKQWEALHDQEQLRQQLQEAHEAFRRKEDRGLLRVLHRRSLRQSIWMSASVAASVALLVVVGGLWIMHQMSAPKTASYIMMRRELDNIRRSQNALINDMHRSAPVNPGAYGGTGFALSQDGYIATNAHVIAGGDSIYVQNSKGDAYKARVVHQDLDHDLAIIKIIDSNFSMPPLPYALSKSEAPLGQDVYTLGYPRDEIVYGRGYVSSQTGFRDDSNSYQVSIPVNPGNSGAPLLDRAGNVIGIISGKQSPSDDIAFAVKSSFLLNMLDSLNDRHLPRGSHLLRAHAPHSLSRVTQIRHLEPYVFMVKVYN